MMAVPGSATDALLRWARGLFVVGVCMLVFIGLGTYAAVHHTAKPEFCGSCHIMLPYVESWRESAHSEIACIECHYEPGGVETFEGKFKALSQVAKYVTNTAGTKPFAEVSDQSCLRAGCHSVPLLAGRLEFRGAAFDHDAHLLESRRGKRLRCTSCHTHVLEGEHFTVEPRVCFTCHFKPDPATGERPAHAACKTCHEAPEQPIQVGGRPFLHQEFTRRGVACMECHQHAIEGDGAVRRERCHSCHEEAGHVEHLVEPDLLHERHVEEHKVECFECHDDIRHGLLPEQPLDPGGDCGACHAKPHGQEMAFFQGETAGAPGPADRMWEVGLGCTACHSGRSAPREAPGHAGLPAAGNVDCVHCHGTSFDGMLARWQHAQQRHRRDLAARQAEVEDRVGESPGAAAELVAARQALAALAADPSYGAHNIRWSQELLLRAAGSLDAAWAAATGGEPLSPALHTLPVRDDAGCALACHAGIEERTEVQLESGRGFPHRQHLLGARLECARCHEVERHGAPAFPRDECGSCHHVDDGPAAGRECGECHAAQVAMNEGTLGSPREEMPSIMAGLDCSDCHGEAPDVVRPTGELCVMCHEEGYDEILTDWQDTTREYLEAVEQALAGEDTQGVPADDLARARELIDAVRADGSRGAHNPMLAQTLLETAMEILGVD